MRRGIDIAIRGAHGHAECVIDLVLAEDLVVAHEAWNDREPRGVRRCPAVGAPAVGVQIEEGARSRVPLRAVVKHVIELVEMTVVAIDDEQMAIG